MVQSSLIYSQSLFPHRTPSGIIHSVVEAEERLTSPNRRQEDLGEPGIRPRYLVEMIGQDRVKENLSILIQAASA